MLRWQFSRFDALPIRDWYAVSAARLAVFGIEQKCAFQDNDGADFHSWHLLGWVEEQGVKKLAAYCRLVDPGIKFDEPSIGRVITTSEFRGQGYGKILIVEALSRHDALYLGQPNRIGAQQRLEGFYRAFGFETVSDIYMEDNILHVEMLRPGKEKP